MSIDTGGPGIGVAGFTDVTVYKNKIGIINAVQVSHALRGPGSLDIGVHVKLGDQVIRVGITASVQVDGDLFRGGSPETEDGFGGCPGYTQIASGIGVFIFKSMGRVEIVHSDGTPH